MTQETELLVKAIEGLKQEPNLFKDYIFPIASAFFTSILGALIAYFALNRQESLLLEKNNLIAANKWILDAIRARDSLIAIKTNYHKQLKANPFQRVAAIPTVIKKSEPILENYQDLAFLVPSEDDVGQSSHKWAQIPRINAMVCNYNSLLHMWEKRNEINEEFKQSIVRYCGGNANALISPEEAISAFGEAGMVALIDVTERCIKLTDHIIIELGEFLEDFPGYVKTIINLKRIKKFGKIIQYTDNGNEALISLAEPEVEVDFSNVQELFGETVQNLKKRHSTGYE